ncbi:MAG: hypothetical protein N3F65_00845 [Nitrososphaeria archaeon]|nr:hypothetical protein [Nitrososphaeria archaeon]
MIIPAKKLLIVTLRDHEARVLKRLGELGVIQLRKLTNEDASRFREMETEKLRELETIYRKFIELSRMLTGSFFEEEGNLYEEYTRLKNTLDDYLTKQSNLMRMKMVVEALLRMGEKQLPEVGSFGEVFSTIGILPRNGLQELQKLMANGLFAMKHVDLSDGQVLIYLVGLMDRWNEVDRALTGLNFEVVKFPDGFPKDCQEAISLIDEELSKIGDKVKSIEKELNDLKERLMGFIEEDSSEAGRLRALYEEVVKLRGILPHHSMQHAEEIELDEKEVRDLINRFQIEYNSIKMQIHRIEGERRRLERLSSILENLKKLTDELPETGDFETISAFAGTLDTKLDETALLYVVCLRDRSKEIRSQLTSFGFKEISVLSKLPRKIDEVLKYVNMKLEENLIEKEKVEARLEELKTRFASKVGAIISYLETNLKVGEALMGTLKSETMRVIQGWVLADHIEKLKLELEKLRGRVGGALFFEVMDPEPGEEVPTALRNPKPFNTFESLIVQYGWPEHGEVDPTIVSGILWTLMFGLMFPDLGHGIAIIAIGIFFSRVFKKKFLGLNSQKLGNLMIGLGISSAFFGLLFGEFFLIETIPLIPGLHAGWIENPSVTLWLIKIAIFFGIAQILLAMVLAIYNELKRNDLPEAILSQHGLAGLISFIGFILTAFYFVGITVVPGILEFPELGIGALLQWPFSLMIAGMLMMILKPVFVKESFSAGIASILETVTAFLANTFSYARIAGFAIVHAALAIFVHKLMEANPIMGIGIGLIFLNLFALTIEFMVCMIQALRLLYYEFFTKFYHGTGSPYRPWKL